MKFANSLSLATGKLSVTMANSHRTASIARSPPSGESNAAGMMLTGRRSLLCTAYPRSRLEQRSAMCHTVQRRSGFALRSDENGPAIAAIK